MPSEVTVFVCGDVMTGRAIDQVLAHPSNPQIHEPHAESAIEYLELAESAHGKIAKPVSPSYIWGEALAELTRAGPAARIVNLETAVTTSEDWEAKGINYRMHPGNVPCLTAAGISCCALANNHALDWGRRGLRETIEVLRDAGIQTAGAGHNRVEAETPALVDVPGGARLLVFAVGARDSGIPSDWAAEPVGRPGIDFISDYSAATAAYIGRRVRSFKRPNDIAILSIHWGGNWGYRIAPEHSVFAHRLIDDGGVDIVHGHSSHHPKGIEVYQGKPILYGCGDFINDYEGIPGHGEFRSHLVLMYFVTVDPATGHLLRLEMTAFEMKQFRLLRAGKDDSEWLRATLTREAELLGTGVMKAPGGGRFILHW